MRPAIADDGNELEFCSTCAFSAACRAAGYDKQALLELHCLVEHAGPYRAGETIFREGTPFTSIAAVRAGTVKTRVIDSDGREHVHGFFLPGEVIGLNAIHSARYPCDAIALDTVTLCRFSFPMMAVLARKLPGLQAQLFRLLSQDIGKALVVAGDYSADDRLAAFLVSMSRRSAARGFPPNQLSLAMSRADIGNYMRLASETVSRVLRRLQDEGKIAVDGRSIEILDPPAMQAMAATVLRD
ncbi:MAG: helix-turn-helix domain-containing protein [Steroidobacteraceae bacterium]